MTGRPLETQQGLPLHQPTTFIRDMRVTRMRILALEPYYGGSHQAFLEGWSGSSAHEWTILPLPPHKWKWRMRHAAVTFADQVRERTARGERWHRLWCSDMLNLAEFRGLAPPHVRDLPSTVYFHENQLTYPVRFESERDYQFAMTNMTSALAADAVWFNSAFHRDSFLDALEAFLRRMPDCQPTGVPETIRRKTRVYPPGVPRMPDRGGRSPGPLRILWAARWEHDKNPEDFFAALAILMARGIEFRISVVGEQFRETPEVFARAHRELASRIDHWGFQENRGQYEAALGEADVFVSTARHEFFGLSAVEAILAGAYPLLPLRLAYPEILGLDEDETATQFFYDGSVELLADRLVELASAKSSLFERTEPIRRRLARFEWSNLAPVLDDAIEQVSGRR
jgi:glycosyltransferase involved in cell wall biosynthesis